MQILIDINDNEYEEIKEDAKKFRNKEMVVPYLYEVIESGIPVKPQGSMIREEKKYEAEILTRGNCMMCGKELEEGLFFCKECEAKAERSEE